MLIIWLCTWLKTESQFRTWVFLLIIYILRYQDHHLTFSRDGSVWRWDSLLFHLMMLSVDLLPEPQPSACSLSTIWHADCTWQVTSLLMHCLYNVCLRTLIHCLTFSLLYANPLNFGSVRKAYTYLIGHLSKFCFKTFSLAHRFLSEHILPNPVLTNRMWRISQKPIEEKVSGRRL